MSEHEIMWIGRQPATDPNAALPTDDPAFEARLREVCAAAGCPVHRYIAARGRFGSWLLEVQREDQTHRLIWNGRDSRLSLDRPNRGGGWDEIAGETVAAGDDEALDAAMRQMLAGSP